MVKALEKKRQQGLQPESILNGKSFISREISSKWNLFNKPLFNFFLIAILGLLVYSNIFNVPFHFDDIDNIIENYKLRDLNNFWPPSESRWFGYLTFALNYYLGGLNVTGYHIVNLSIHILNAILVYWLVILTLKTPFFSSSNPPIPPLLKGGEGGFALFSALLFVAHPIQTQAVTYIVQRFTSLATMFYLLSLGMYIKFRMQDAGYKMHDKENPKSYTMHYASWIMYLVSLISAILAMKTKEIAFTLPIIIVLYEFMFFSVSRVTHYASRFLFILPFLLTMLIIPLSLTNTDKPIGDAIGELREASQETDEIPRWSYLFTQFRVIVTYIRLLFLPINQNLDYDYPIYHSFFNPEVFLSLLFLLLFFAFGIYLLCAKRYALPHQADATRLITFGIFWFFITLSVESSIIPIRDVIFEHRMYLPSIGFIIVFVSATFYILQAMIQNPKRSLAACCLLLATAVIVLSVAAYQRNAVWQDEISLWEDVVRKSPQKARGHNNLGLAYYNKGLTDMAIEHYQIALRINPNYAEAHNNLGIAYKDKGLTDMAIEHYQIALRINPEIIEAYNNLGVAYKDKGLTDKAIEHYQIALRLKPDNAEAHNNLGNAYKDKGMTDKAIEHYQIALRINPNYAEAHNNLGNAYKDKGMTDKAIEHYQIALRIKPGLVDAHVNMANAYDDKGLTDKAIEHYQIALKLKPDYAEAHYNLGVAYERRGLLDEAIKEYQITLRLNPEDKITRNKLNRILQIQRSK